MQDWETESQPMCSTSPPAGEAVRFTTQYLLSASAGRRPRVPGAVVIISDRKSADDLVGASSSLRASGRRASAGGQVGLVPPCPTGFDPCWLCSGQVWECWQWVWAKQTPGSCVRWWPGTTLRTSSTFVTHPSWTLCTRAWQTPSASLPEHKRQVGTR